LPFNNIEVRKNLNRNQTKQLQSNSHANSKSISGATEQKEVLSSAGTMKEFHFDATSLDK
jgi:hypothetical protein